MKLRTDDLKDLLKPLTLTEDDIKECESIIKKHKPKEPVMITLPIEDYNRLRKLEIKQEIKKIKKRIKMVMRNQIVSIEINGITYPVVNGFVIYSNNKNNDYQY